MRSGRYPGTEVRSSSSPSHWKQKESQEVGSIGLGPVSRSRVIDCGRIEQRGGPKRQECGLVQKIEVISSGNLKQGWRREAATRHIDRDDNDTWRHENRDNNDISRHMNRADNVRLSRKNRDNNKLSVVANQSNDISSTEETSNPSPGKRVSISSSVPLRAACNTSDKSSNPRTRKMLPNHGNTSKTAKKSCDTDSHGISDQRSLRQSRISRNQVSSVGEKLVDFNVGESDGIDLRDDLNLDGINKNDNVLNDKLVKVLKKIDAQTLKEQLSLEKITGDWDSEDEV